MKLDHIGIVVRSLAEGRQMLEAAFGIEAWTAEIRDDGFGVLAQFGKDATGICYELVTPLSDTSPVSRALAQGINIINHVAYLIPDLDAEASRLRREGFIAVGSPVAGVAFAGARIQFFFSKTRLLFEMIEAPAHIHRYVDARWAERASGFAIAGA